MMTHAYDENLLYKAQVTLAWMFEYGVNEYGIDISDFYQWFISSKIAYRFAIGDVSIVAGCAGGELAYKVVQFAHPNVDMIGQIYRMDRSPEYWVGYVLAYYQWERGLSFEEISQAIKIEDIKGMYPKYHEMDIAQFVVEMDRLMDANREKSRLKRLRTYAKLSQSQLAKQTGIPVRTIQQYEQGKKEIYHASFDYILRFSKALNCRPEDIIE